MNWVLIVGIAWLAVSVVVAALIAGGIRVADRQRRRELEAQRRAAAAAGALPLAPRRRSADSSRRRAWPRARKTAVGDCVPTSERSGSARDTGAR